MKCFFRCLLAQHIPGSLPLLVGISIDIHEFQGLFVRHNLAADLEVPSGQRSLVQDYLAVRSIRLDGLILGTLQHNFVVWQVRGQRAAVGLPVIVVHHFEDFAALACLVGHTVLDRLDLALGLLAFVVAVKAAVVLVGVLVNVSYLVHHSTWTS